MRLKLSRSFVAVRSSVLCPRRYRCAKDKSVGRTPRLGRGAGDRHRGRGAPRRQVSNSAAPTPSSTCSSPGVRPRRHPRPHAAGQVRSLPRRHRERLPEASSPPSPTARHHRRHDQYGQSAAHPVVVEQSSSPLPINFPTNGRPDLHQGGCNAGGCHGKIRRAEASSSRDSASSQARTTSTSSWKRAAGACSRRPRPQPLLLKSSAPCPTAAASASTWTPTITHPAPLFAQGMPYGGRTTPTAPGSWYCPAGASMASGR